MPKLEILNSQLTNRAGDWAMSFYAKEQTGCNSLEEVERLNLAGKGILYMASAEVFGRMINLKKLDISDHPEFFLTAEQRAQMESAALDGLENKDNVDFTECQISIHDVLPHLNTVEELICGYQLEEHICKERDSKGFLPKLKLLNGVDVEIIDMEERNKIRDAIQIMEKLPLIANCYVVGQGIGS